MWQLHSLETVHPVHKSSATFRKHWVNLIQTLKDSHPFVWTSSRSLKPRWAFGLHRNVVFPRSGSYVMCYLHLGVTLFPLQCEGGGKGPGRGLWSIYSYPRLHNHFIVMLKGIKELFIHLLCWACLIDYWYSQYVSLSAWPRISDLSVLSACCIRAIWKKLTQTHKVKLHNILI